MKRHDFTALGISMILALFVLQASGQGEEEPIRIIRQHREKQTKEFRDPKESPLSKKDRRHFKGLNYYPIDLAYRVNVKFVKNESPVLFKMKTTTDRLPDYVKYGEVIFTLMGQAYTLEVYQSPDIMKRPGYEDYLFIPFTDETNGSETYAVGRYLEFRIPTSDELVVDFNLSYNPYCSYGHGYSCPIPPSANHMALAVRAGEKVFNTSSH